MTDWPLLIMEQLGMMWLLEQGMFTKAYDYMLMAFLLVFNFPEKTALMEKFREFEDFCVAKMAVVKAQLKLEDVQERAMRAWQSTQEWCQDTGKRVLAWCLVLWAQ